MLVLLCRAQFMVILDVTVTAYTLCFGGLMLLGGRLADAISRRGVFLTGLAVFTLASLASGLADSATTLVDDLLSPSASALLR